MHQENTGGVPGNGDGDCVAIWTFISPASLQRVSEFLDAKGCGLSTGSDIPNFVMDSLQETFCEEGGVVVVTQKAGVHPYVFRAVCNDVYEIVCV
jgi:hypothetical protein